MARANLKAVSVYLTEEQADILAQAAASEHRSTSNFLLSHGLMAAEAAGFKVMSAHRPETTERGRTAQVASRGSKPTHPKQVQRRKTRSA
jgi:uncharacterized protein (DUF1778 family)